MKNVSQAVKAMLKAMGLPSAAEAKKKLASGDQLSKRERELLERIVSGNLPTSLADVSPEARRKVQA